MKWKFGWKGVAVVSLVVLAAVVLAFGAYDKAYKSYEFIGGYARFRVNIPRIIEYCKARSVELKAQLAKETSALKKKKLEEKIAHYDIAADVMTKNKVKKVCVFGAFNGWTTFASEIPNILVPSAGNPDTWYTMTNVNLNAKKGDSVLYKFVFDCGVEYNAGDKVQDLVYIEDPQNPTFTDDGFDGFNSILKMP